jgi:CPA2 family monovalent cation:H+ antiporter-2
LQRENAGTVILADQELANNISQRVLQKLEGQDEDHKI